MTHRLEVFWHLIMVYMSTSFFLLTLIVFLKLVLTLKSRKYIIMLNAYIIKTWFIAVRPLFYKKNISDYNYITPGFNEYVKNLRLVNYVINARDTISLLAYASPVRAYMKDRCKADVMVDSLSQHDPEKGQAIKTKFSSYVLFFSVISLGD